MRTEQTRLGEPPVDKEQARAIALDIIRNNYGNIPYPGEPFLDGELWIVPITARYPRVLVNERDSVPEKVRFMTFDNLGKIEIVAANGQLNERSTYWDVQSAINAEFELVKTSVQKALVKNGAMKFSQLPLSEHMHTPIEDILSWILIYNSMDLEAQLEFLPIDRREKFLQNVRYLESVGLIRKTGTTLEPGNPLIEIERTSRVLPLALSNSLAYFFEKGYEHINTIRQVLGPHLFVSGAIYQRSIENGSPSFLKIKSLENVMRDFYPSQYDKIFKLPRYLVQCESVGLVNRTIVGGENAWSATEDLFIKVMGEEDILEPIRQFIGN